MIATAIAAALCAANVALWSFLISAARATDREARARWDAARHRRDDVGRFVGVARGEAGQGGQAID